MANLISLLEYLQVRPPEVPVINQGQSRQNTANKSYNHRNISFIGSWDDFNLDTIMNQYGQLLTQAQIEPDRMPASSPPPITSENSLRRRCAFYLEARVRRSLRRGFEQLEASGELGNRSVVSFGKGS
ncbi:hypothetical protein VTN49DRAFT_1382 [Thermomyces lanuginosus]|uniref:uncharacterized protein n=1 Tax=Thermomyces lanuginosus TaxID=5541 RepID=UPI003743B86B